MRVTRGENKYLFMFTFMSMFMSMYLLNCNLVTTKWLLINYGSNGESACQWEGVPWECEVFLAWDETAQPISY